MNDSERIAEQVTRALNGNAWHGPSWREVLRGVSPATAGRRPIARAHSIFELVGHAASWNEIVTERLAGGSPSVPNERNWPETKELDQATWEAAKARLFLSGQALEHAIATFPSERLHRKRPRTDGTWQELMLGQLQHLLYHCGQVAQLKKAR